MLFDELDPEDNVDPELVLKVLETVKAFLEIPIVPTAYFNSPDASLGRQPISDQFLLLLRSRARDAADSLESMEYLYGLKRVAPEFADAFKGALERNERKQHHFLPPLEQGSLEDALSAAYKRINEHIGMQSAEASATRAAEALTRAEASAALVSQVAGATADVVISSHFQAMATDELSSANEFRLWTMRAMGVGGIIGAVFLLGPALGVSALEIETGDYVHLLQRVLVVGAVFAFAAYTGRQAHNHRTQANWAASLAVQLQTFDAYCDAIDDQASKDQLRTAFAARAFGEHPALRGESSSDNGDALVQKAADLASKFLPGDK